MSIAFNGTDSKLQLNSISPALSFPVSIFCWIKPTSTSVNQFAVGVGNSAGNEELMIYVEGAGSGKVRAFQTGTAGAAANSTTSISTAWTPALAIFTSASSRTIYYGAGAAVTETTDTSPANLSNLNKIGLGMRTKNESFWFAGDIAEFAIWSGGTALGATEWASLSGGAVPSTVSNSTLYDYWELRTDAATQTGTNGRVLTKTNTSQGATHPIGATGYTITAETGSYTVSGVAATLVVARKIIADVGSYSYTGVDATLTKATPGAFVIVAEAGSYVWSGTDAYRDLAFNAESGTYSTTGYDVSFTLTEPMAYTITAEPGSYTLSGRTVYLLGPGDTIPTTKSSKLAINIGLRL